MASAFAMPSGVSSMAISDDAASPCLLTSPRGDLTVALQRTGAGDRAFTQRRKAAYAYKCLGFSARAHIRADDAEHARVEQTRCMVKLVTGDTARAV